MKFGTDVDDVILNQFLEGAKDDNHWGRHIGKIHSIFQFAITLQPKGIESQVKAFLWVFDLKESKSELKFDIAHVLLAI